jgi:polysaccharide export outer membrane protein
MNYIFYRKWLLATVTFIGLFCFNSCSLKENVVYFQNAKDFETIVDTETFTPKFKINDILSIHVSTFDTEASNPFNLYKNGGGVGSNPEAIDYLVDFEGNVDYPVLGKIKLLGLTIEGGKKLLKEKLEVYLKDPVINIRLLNFRVSVLGEVNRPGSYAISGERITILEAIGLAGDLSIKGRRDNVMVMRDFNGTKTYTRVDLTSKEVFNSPVYFLTQNDVIYVEPNNSATTNSAGDSRIGIVTSVGSLVIGIVSLYWIMSRG